MKRTQDNKPDQPANSRDETLLMEIIRDFIQISLRGNKRRACPKRDRASSMVYSAFAALMLSFGGRS